ncbi:hypothetical protein RvY_06013 [Ramazzottius varieornatus]|uniref:Uncharacterized protein n=1 Tax=Ramazzottius varieornatus TaxID=947166 RepID=A0A1D1UXJ7_RAMVA|nr:hypothetical protein RvY_06013 [Ramazzottius varieornatus]
MSHSGATVYEAMGSVEKGKRKQASTACRPYTLLTFKSSQSARHQRTLATYSRGAVEKKGKPSVMREAFGLYRK